MTTNTKTVALWLGLVIIVTAVLASLYPSNRESFRYSAILPSGTPLHVEYQKTNELVPEVENASEAMTFKPKYIFLIRWDGGFNVVPDEKVPAGKWREKLLSASQSGTPITL